MATIFLNTQLGQFLHLYADAVVHLAWLESKSTAEHHLLFGMVELLPKELPAPPPEEFTPCPVEDAHVHLTRTICVASKAIEWYETAREGTCAPMGSRTNTVLLRSPLGEEPPWPELGLRDSASPFVPSTGYDARIHHLLSLADSATFPWPSEAAKQRALQLLCSWFHFDVTQYDEYLGSLTLIAHNPILRQIHEIPTKDEDGRHSTLVRLEKRQHAEANEVALAVSEKRPTTRTGQVAKVTLDVTHQIVHGREEGAFGISAYDPTWGLLYQEPELHFLKSIGVSIYAPPAPRVVEGAAGKYEVPQRLPRNEEAPKLEQATQKLTLAASQRKRRRSPPSKLLQRIEHRSTKAAQDYARRLVHSADRLVYIIDPYFRESDVEFILATGSEHVQVRVLGSALGFQDQSDAEPGVVEAHERRAVSAEMRRRNARQIHSQLLQLEKSGYRNAVELRVMPGRKAPYFHDRFIDADDKAWALGGSLSDLGNRLSAVLRLPDPAPLIVHANSCWEDSTPVSQWMVEPPEGDSSP